MVKSYFFCFLSLMFSIFSDSPLFAQNPAYKNAQDAAYREVINKRAGKIVFELDIPDTAKAGKVQDIIADQYRNLNAIYTERDTLISIAKRKNADNKAAADSQVTAIKLAIIPSIEKLHTRYLSSLSELLTPEQVGKVKDGMTYGVLQVTYHSYLDMIPSLKEEEKKQIHQWLVEAREYAMDAESSEKKHAWFGKYKGKINNYLSKQGYDSKKEREEWMKRLKAKESVQTN